MKRLLTSSLCLALLVVPILSFIAPPLKASAETGSQASSETAQEHQSVIISGNGNTVKAIQVDFSPSRVTLQGIAEVEITGDKFPGPRFSGGYSDQTSFTLVMFNSGDLLAKVDATGEWKLTIEPIKGGGVLPLSGKGPFISDLIELTEPMEITLIADGSKLNEEAQIVAFIQYPPTEDGSFQDEYLAFGERTTLDKPRITLETTLNPEGHRKQGVLSVYCNAGLEWSVLVDGLPAPMAFSELTIGSSGQAVLDMKGRFLELGYFSPANFNDRFTDKTAETVKQFEKNNGLTVDGVADVVMLGVLFSDKALGK